MSRNIVVIGLLVLLAGCHSGAVTTPIPVIIAQDQAANARSLATRTSAPITHTPAPATPTSVPPTSTQTPEAAPTVTVLESGSASGSDITITYIRTSGFLFTSEQGVKVLVDALFVGLPEFGLVTPEQRDQMEQALPPFDDVDVILVTHAHRDHFDYNIMREHLEHNPQAVLVLPEAAAIGLKDLFPYRVKALEVAPGEAISLTVNGVAVQALGLIHAANQAYPHLGFLFTLDGKRILHMGDSADLPDNLMPEAVDLAFIQSGFIAPPAKNIIKMHWRIPVPYRDLQQWVLTPIK